MLRHHRIHPRLTGLVFALAATVFLTGTPGFAADPKPAPEAAPAPKAADSDKLVPIMELEPQLDTSEPDPSAFAEPTQEPLKAKAVVVDINSKDFRYDEDRSVYTATGDVHVVISEQNSELFADKVTYDQNQDLMIAEGRVIIIKNGKKTEGSYAKIDLTRESALINDVTTSVESVRVKSKNALVNNKYLEFENGRLIITPGMLTKADGSMRRGSNNRNQQLQGRVRNDQNSAMQDMALQNNLLNTPAATTAAATETVTLETSSAEEAADKSFMHMKVKEIEVHRWEDGYNKIDLNWPALYLGNFKALTMPNTQFSYDETTGQMEYLGPDMGYDPDYGGFHYGPGWDFRLGKGSFRFSPLLSYGGAGRRGVNRSRYEDQGIGPGVGFVGHYRDAKTLLDFGYNTRVGQPVGYLEREVFDGKTRVVASMNEDYRNGFLEFERPGYSLAVTDSRKVAEWSRFRIDSYESIGFYKDEFFPLNTNEFFVQPEDGATPGTAGRLQLQARLRNTKPLFQVGNPLGTNLTLGFLADVSMAGYTSGDIFALARGGPRLDAQIGSRYRTQLQYFLAATGGETPFIFDSYYRGRQNLQWQNAFKVNEYLTLGLNNGMSLERDNAKGSLFTDNQIFMMVGPKTVKLNLAFDVVRRRTSFGVNFFPGNGDAKAIDFERMKIFQPEHYGGPALTP